MAAAASDFEPPRLKASLQKPFARLHRAFYPEDPAPGGFCGGLTMWVIGNLLNNRTKYDIIRLTQILKAILALDKAILANKNKIASSFHEDRTDSIVKVSFDEDMASSIEQAKIWINQIVTLQKPKNSEAFEAKGLLCQQDTRERPADAFGILFNNENYSAYSTPHYAIYDQAEFASFLSIVKTEMGHLPYLLISTRRHAVTLWYDPGDEVWNIADANHGIGYTKKLHIMARKIFTEIFHSTPEKPILNFCIYFFDHAPIADRFLRLKMSPSWKKMHESPRHLEPTFRMEPFNTIQGRRSTILQWLSLKALFDHVNEMIKGLRTIQKDESASNYEKVKREYFQQNYLEQLFKFFLYVLSEDILLPTGFTKDTGINKDTLFFLMCFFLESAERQPYLKMILTERDTLLSQIFWEKRGVLPCSTSRGVLFEVKQMHDEYVALYRPSTWAFLFGNTAAGVAEAAATPAVTAETSLATTRLESPPALSAAASAEDADPGSSTWTTTTGWAL